MTTGVTRAGPITICARPRWTNTGVMLRKGRTYRITAAGTWHDWHTPSGPAGYRSNNVLLWLAAPLRRTWRARWFALIGAQRSWFPSRFTIGREITHRARRDGPLWCYANDVWFMYFNNNGKVEVTVEEIPA